MPPVDPLALARLSEDDRRRKREALGEAEVERRLSRARAVARPNQLCFAVFFAALSIAVAPSGPIMLLLRFNDTRCLLNRSADARSSAPASVI